MNGLPRRMTEKNKVWEQGKAYVLNQLAERGPISLRDLAKELNEKFKFAYDTAPYGIVKGLVKLNRIHYESVGSDGTRMLVIGPKTGDISVMPPVKQARDDVRLEVEEVAEGMNMDVVEEVDEVDKDDKDVDITASAPYDEGGFKPMTLSEEGVKTLVELAEESMRSELVAPVEEQRPAPPPVVPVEEPSEEERERLAMEKVTRDTARKILLNVDKELEKALSPEVRAQLRLVYAMANEAGMGLEKATSPLAQRDLLKRRLG